MTHLRLSDAPFALGRRWLWGLGLALALAGCGEEAAAPAPAPAPPPPAPPEPEPEPEPPPPPPPPGEPFLVSIVLPAADDDDECMGQVLCPDDGTDPDSAMAQVNRKAVVVSSHAGRVQPLFLPGAPAANIAVGENALFEFTTWSLLQREAFTTGAAFEFTRSAPANAAQAPGPVGNTVHITCNPFTCSEALAPPPGEPGAPPPPPPPPPPLEESAVCGDVEVDFQLNMGAVFNGGNGSTEAGLGIDLGWTYTSNVDGMVEHVLGSRRYPGSDAEASSVPTFLNMARDGEANQFGGGELEDADDAIAEIPSNGEEEQKPDGSGGTVPDFVANIKAMWDAVKKARTGGGPIRNGDLDCLPTRDFESGNKWLDGLEYSYEDLAYSDGRVATGRPRTTRPGGPGDCFRLVTNGFTSDGPNNPNRQNYLPAYELHFTPKTPLRWVGSEVKWPTDEDPLGGLSCETTVFAAAEQIDICDAFEAEAEAYWDDGLEGPFSWFPITDGDDRLVRIEIRQNKFVAPNEPTSGPKLMRRAPGSQFTNLWLSNRRALASVKHYQTDDLRPGPLKLGPLSIDGNQRDYNLYWWHCDAGLAPGSWPWGSHGFSPTDFEQTPPLDPPVRTRPRVLLAFELEDSDGNPIYGDFGKLDVGDDGVADNYESDAQECSNSDGAKCNADDVLFEGEIEFVLYQDQPDRCSWTADVSLTCKWDANGGTAEEIRSATPDGCPDPNVAAAARGHCNGDVPAGKDSEVATGVAKFLTCTVN